MSAQFNSPMQPEEQRKEMGELLGRARALYLQGQPADQIPPMPVYQGEHVAPLSQLQHRAIQLGAQIDQHQPYLNQANQIAQQANRGFGQDYRQYMNPFEQQAAQAVSRDVSRNFTENVLPALEANFIRRGQHGSSKHRDLVRRAQRDMTSELASRLSQMRAHGYETAAKQFENEQSRRAQLANIMAGLGESAQKSRLADVGILEHLGEIEQQQRQARNDVDYQLWLKGQAYPWEQLAMRQAVFSGLPFKTGESAYFAPLPQPRVNTAGQISALAASLWGARRAGMFGGQGQ